MPHQLSLFEEPPDARHALFFALMPDDKAAGDAAHLVHSLRRQRLRLQKPLEPARLHVTLCGLGGFVGQMPPHLFAHADAAVAAVRMDPFPVAFDRIHALNGRLSLRPSSAGPLHDFGSQLRATLIKGGLRRWLRWRFSPHMTLSYAAEDMAEVQVDPVAWTVRDFVLVESLQGLHRHIRRGAWPLH